VLKKQCLFIIFACSFANTDLYASWNNPYPHKESQENILYSVFYKRPKFLDPARSYDNSEYQFLAQIYEAPLQYHYLYRPYQLEPQTLTQMPIVSSYNKAGQIISNSGASSKANIERLIDQEIAYTEYRLTLQKGILFQPHPALAKDDNGQYRYHSLTTAQTRSIKTLNDLPHTGTREMTAHDYLYQIKRIANPASHSPINGLMKGYIVGLKELSDRLKERTIKTGETESSYVDLRQYPLSGVTVHNDYELSIRIKGQYPQFIYWLGMPFFAPMPWEAERFYAQPGFAENNINLNWYPIGTGPYMLTENNPNLRMVLAKNPNFRGQAYPSKGEADDKENGLLNDAGKTVPFIEKVIFNLEKESIPYWNKFLQGYFDSSGISSDSFDNAISFSASGEINLTEEMKAKGIQLNTVVDTSIFYMGFNMLDPIVGGKSERARLLRQAISIAIDQEEYISIFRNGRGIPGQSPIPPEIFGHQEGEKGINPYVYEWKNGKAKRKSIEQAKQLLAQAGYTNGIDQKNNKPLTLYYESIDSGAGSKSRLNWLRKQFEKINIQLVIRATDYNRFREKMSNGNAQIFNLGWNADYPDPENFLFLLHGPQGKVKYKGANAANYSNPEFNRLFDQMKNMTNSPERQDIINQMLEIVRYDAPWSFGFNPKTFSLKHSWYKNSKPFIMSSTGTLKYRRINTEERNRAREAWNQPIVWPVALLLIFTALLIIPAIMAYRRYERSRAL